MTLENLTRPIVGIENRTAQEAFDIMADRFRSYLSTAPLGQAPLEGVKALEWTEPQKPNGETCFYDHCTAQTPFGVYSIEWKSWKAHDAYTVYLPSGDYFDAQPSLTEAKAAAQAHFNAAISSSLLPASAEPVACPEDATEEMVEAALTVDWSNEDERAVIHNVWHAMRAARPPTKAEGL